MKSKYGFRLVLAVVLLILSVSLAGCGSSAQGKVIDEIMNHMAAHDAEAAFEHMSTAARDSGVTADGLSVFISEYPILVDGYKGMSVSNMSISTNNGVSTTEMMGTFSYEDGSTSSFDALLHKEADLWMVTTLNINK